MLAKSNKHSVNLTIWNAMAAASGSLPACALFGLAGVLFLLGYDGLAYVLGWTAGFALTAVVVAAPLRKSGAATIPGFFDLRYGTNARACAVVIVFLSSILILVAEISFAGLIGSRLLGVSVPWVVIATLGVAVLISLASGIRGTTGAGVAQYALLLASFMVVLALLAAKTQGLGLPQISYGEALARITGLETSMLEKGLADLKSLTPNSKPFLQIDALNFFALSLCLMAGTAAMPHIAGRHLAARSASEARFSAAWTLFFVFLILLAAPAIAAFAKFEIYTLIAKGTPLNDLPPWMETASRLDLMKVYGVSLEMLDDASAAVKSGATDLSSVSEYLKAEAPRTAEAWAQLKVPARTALFDAAKAARDSTDAAAWTEFRNAVLPAAAQAAGNKTGLLTHGALGFDPAAIMISAPGIAGAPLLVTGLLAAGALAALLATTRALLITIASALRPGPAASPARQLFTFRAALLIAAVLAGAAAILYPPDPITAVVAAFSIAAAGLFPALALGLWWKRANVWGAVTGMAAGLALSLFYIVGTQVLPVKLYETSRALSNASDAAVRKFDSLESAWMAAPDGDAKTRALAALETHARGTPWRAGVANWIGVHGASAALFGLPAGFLGVIVLSLLTSRRRPETVAMVEDLLRP